MKKSFVKLLSLILCVICALSCFALAAFAEGECEHTYTSTVVAPTCADQGYTLFTCTKCGDYYKENFTPAAGHSFTSSIWETVDTATCTSEGHERRKCLNCDAFEIKTIPVTEHTDADKNGFCDVCGAEVGKTSDKVDNSPFAWVKALIQWFKNWWAKIFA